MSASSEVPTLHPDKISHGYLVYDIVACVFTFLAAVCVTLRFVHRARTNDFRWDDWAILASLIFAVGVLIGTLLISVPSIAGAGYHITTYSVPQLNNYFKLALASDVLYNFSVAGSKISILFFYRRIFSIDGHFLLFMRITGGLIVANCLAAALGLILTDNPVAAQWNVGTPYTTINGRAFWSAMAVVNILLDILILAIAQRRVWKLNMSLQRKLLISSLFVLGAFTIITSILRIVYLLTVDLSDLTYTLTTAGMWTNIEMNLSVICACIPIIYSLFNIRRGGTQSATAQSSGWKRSGPLITIGGGRPSYKSDLKSGPYHSSEDGLSNSAAYQTIVETDGETHSLEPLDPIRVRTEYQVR